MSAARTENKLPTENIKMEEPRSGGKLSPSIQAKAESDLDEYFGSSDSRRRLEFLSEKEVVEDEPRQRNQADSLEALPPSVQNKEILDVHKSARPCVSLIFFAPPPPV